MSLALSLLLLSACRSVEPRPAASSYGCMQAVRADVIAQLGEVSDKHRHCMVSAYIARRCSVTEAYLACLGKEFADMVTPHGDAEWADWQADRAGIACGRKREAVGMALCCLDSGY